MLSVVIEHLEQETFPPSSGEWFKFPLKRYGQLWSQLTIHQSILCRKIKSPTMTNSHLLIVVPCSLQKLFLKLAHDDSRHQGLDCTMSKLSGMAYWIGMGRRVADHCKFCVKCQLCKAPAPKPAHFNWFWPPGLGNGGSGCTSCLHKWKSILVGG